jgi:hypothetical protein
VCHHHRLEAKRERADVYIVELAALLRDISDDKLNGLSSPTSWPNGMPVTCREPAEQRSTARYIDDIFSETAAAWS